MAVTGCNKPKQPFGPNGIIRCPTCLLRTCTITTTITNHTLTRTTGVFHNADILLKLIEIQSYKPGREIAAKVSQCQHVSLTAVGTTTNSHIRFYIHYDMVRCFSLLRIGSYTISDDNDALSQPRRCQFQVGYSAVIQSKC